MIGGGWGENCELYAPRCCEIFILLHFLKCGLDQREDTPPGVADSWKEVHSSAGEWKANRDHLMRYWLSFQCPNFFSVFWSFFPLYLLNIPCFIFLGVIKCNPHILHYFHIWQSDLGKNFVSGLLWKFWDPSLLRPFLGHNSAKKTLLSSPLLHLYLSFRGNLKYYFFKEDWIRIPIMSLTGFII